MQRKIIILTVVLLTTILSCKKKSNESLQEEFLTLQGTVYVNQVPESDVLVETYISGQRLTRNTDENGRYSVRGTGAGWTRTYVANYGVRAMNPLTDEWSEFRQGQGPIGIAITEDFYFSDDDLNKTSTETPVLEKR